MLSFKSFSLSHPPHDAMNALLLAASALVVFALAGMLGDMTDIDVVVHIV